MDSLTLNLFQMCCHYISASQLNKKNYGKIVYHRDFSCPGSSFETKFLKRNTMESTQEIRKQKMDDQGALSGLRGYAAVHIMIFHSFYYSKAHLHLHASVFIYVNIIS